jgi:hypothetical protein
MVAFAIPPALIEAYQAFRSVLLAYRVASAIDDVREDYYKRRLTSDEVDRIYRALFMYGNYAVLKNASGSPISSKKHLGDLIALYQEMEESMATLTPYDFAIKFLEKLADHILFKETRLEQGLNLIVDRIYRQGVYPDIFKEIVDHSWFYDTWIPYVLGNDAKSIDMAVIKRVVLTASENLNSINLQSSQGRKFIALNFFILLKDRIDTYKSSQIPISLRSTGLPLTLNTSYLPMPTKISATMHRRPTHIRQVTRATRQLTELSEMFNDPSALRDYQLYKELERKMQIVIDSLSEDEDDD